MSKQNVASFIVETLLQSGVKRIYGVAGDSLNGITEAVRKRKGIEWIHMRHEEAAAFAAGAEAHVTGELVVCAGSCGPGNLHLINGLYDCHRSRVPVLAIAAQIPSQEIGTGYFQETHPEQIFAECSHYCETVSNPAQIPRVLKLAMAHALGMGGVSVIVLSGNTALSECESPIQALPIRPYPYYLRPTDDAIDQLAASLNAAGKVTILAGAGCANAHEELIAIAAALKAPIVHAMRGKEYIEYDNPFDVGMTGLLGFSSGYFAMESCDVLLMIGTDFPYTQFFPKAKTIQIDVRPENIGRRTRVDLGVIGSVKETLTLVFAKLDKKQDDAHLRRALEHYAKTRKDLNELAEPGSIEHALHPQFVTKSISEMASDDAIFTCDVGTPTIWAARYLTMNGQRSLVGSFVHGSMAGAMPQAIGLQLAYPQRQVIALCGDGGFAMLMGDVLTLKQYELPVKIVIFNNSSLGFVELEMESVGLIPSAIDLKNPDFAKLAQSAGLRGFQVNQSSNFKPVLQEALSYKGPALIDVKVSHSELSIPPHITLEQVHGFGLFALKAILNGKADSVMDLAKVNMWR